MTTDDYGMPLAIRTEGTPVRIMMSDPKTFLVRPAKDMNL